MTKGYWLFCHAFALTLSVLCVPAVYGGNITVSRTTTSVDAAGSGVGPGDTIYLQAGTRDQLTIRNMAGSASNPITVTNLNGQVTIDSTNAYYCLKVTNSHHFIIKGTPNPGVYDYGLRFTRSGGMGIQLTDRTTDFELRDMEMFNTGFAGVMAKDDNQTGTSWAMENVFIHDLYIHDTGGEGLYIGSSAWMTKDPHELHNVHIYDNTIVNAGWDGIQLGCATQNSSIHDNVIINAGTENEQYQTSGIQLNPGSATHIYNNYIEGGPTQAIFLYGRGGNKVYNNLLVRPGSCGIYVGDDNDLIAGTAYYLMSNTIIEPGLHGCWFRSRASRGSIFHNNIVTDPGGSYLSRYYGDVQVSESNNVYLPSTATVGFVSPALDNYRLQPTSIAVDAGRDLSSYGVIDDLEHNPRPEGIAYDVGAYELFSGNYPPSVSAGPDASTQTGSVALAGEATDDGLPDPPGELAVFWSKVSGPGTVEFADAASPATTATLSQPGSYVLRLAATDGEYLRSDDVQITYEAVPHLEYDVAYLGGGKYGWTFSVYSQDGLMQPYTVELAFQGIGGTIQQVAYNGTASVHTELMADAFDGTGGYSKALDTWACSPFGDNPVAGTNPLTSSPLTGFYEAANAFAMCAYTGPGSAYGDGVPVAYVVCDGKVGWFGAITRDGVERQVMGVTDDLPSLPGDYNGDGEVSGSDYVVWADTFGNDGSPGKEDLRADGNGDGAVTGADYVIWADHFGESANPLTVSQATAPAVQELPAAVTGETTPSSPAERRAARLEARRQLRAQRQEARHQGQAARAGARR